LEDEIIVSINDWSISIYSSSSLGAAVKNKTLLLRPPLSAETCQISIPISAIIDATTTIIQHYEDELLEGGGCRL
jgi:hypothetical protein